MGFFSSNQSESTTNSVSTTSENTNVVNTSSSTTTHYHNLRDEEILLPYSINRGFDELMRCHSFGHQILYYYRYGGKKSCSLPWKKFKFILSLSALSKEEKIQKIQQFEDDLVKEKRALGGSLDVWELREHPPANFPPKLE